VAGDKECDVAHNTNGEAMTDTDVESKKTNPSAAYNHPEEILSDTALNREQKIEILREWYYDAMRLQESDSRKHDGRRARSLTSGFESAAQTRCFASQGIRPECADRSRRRCARLMLYFEHVDALRGKGP